MILSESTDTELFYTYSVAWQVSFRSFAYFSISSI